MLRIHHVVAAIGFPLLLAGCVSRRLMAVLKWP